MDMIGIDMYNTKHNEKSNNMLPCNMSRVTNAFFFQEQMDSFFPTNNEFCFSKTDQSSKF